MWIINKSQQTRNIFYLRPILVDSFILLAKIQNLFNKQIQKANKLIAYFNFPDTNNLKINIT